MFQNGIKCTDTVVVRQNLLYFAERSILLETNKIILTNYRAFLIDMNLENYFEDELSC